MEAPNFNPPSSWRRKAEASGDRPVIKFPSSVNFCQLINNPGKDIKVIRRIGSESTEGEVYQIQYKGTDAALKVMPITTDKDNEKNQNEMEIANLASDMVLENTWPHFPIVYGFGRCYDSNFYNPSWKGKSTNYACMLKLRETLPSKTKQMDALYRTGQSPETIARRFNLDLQLCEDLETPSDFLISELAREDLSSWASLIHSSKEWKSNVSDILETILFMREEMQISHNDLHWGNVLIKFVDNSDIPLVHDFGKSGKITNDNLLDDINKFISSWTGASYQIPSDIREFFIQAEKDIKENKDIPEILDNL